MYSRDHGIKLLTISNPHARYRSVKRKNNLQNRPLRSYPYEDRVEFPRSYSNGRGNFYNPNQDPNESENQEMRTAESIEEDTRNFKLKALRLQLVGTAAWNLRFMATKKRDALAANAVATEQKASKVLGLVFFAFLVCWTPFFVLNVYMAACPGCAVHEQFATMVLWLGYVSSTINPLIYTVFNRTFRSAFINLLRCRYSFFKRPIRGFSASDNIGGYTTGFGCPSQPPTACSVHTLSSYVRSPSFPPTMGHSTAMASPQEHQM